ncbi:hypothetical protein JTB14_000995 [Gonioctena quinquepunctata]|nr:hypothetical protein JTB14_000995 [Gonioctena quinquepunctata]
MDNYLEYRLSKVKARMKPSILPHLFECQPERQSVSEKPRLFEEILARKKIIAECMGNYNRTEQEESESSIPVAAEDHHPPVAKTEKDVACQTRKRYFRSKAVQVTFFEKRNVSTSTLE